MNLSPIVSLDRVTVRASHDALCDFPLRLADALCLAHVDRLVVSRMIEMQCMWMSTVSAVRAAALHFVGIEPAANCGRALIGLTVDQLSVARDRKAPLPPRLDFFGLISALTRFSVGCRHLIGVGLAPSPSRFARGFWMSFAVTPCRITATRLLLFGPVDHNWSITCTTTASQISSMKPTSRSSASSCRPSCPPQ
jgi:hypothetical protein